MNRRDAMTGAVGSLIAATLWPGRARSLIFPAGAVASTKSTHDLLLNLGPLAYFDSQQMFLNVLKQAGTNSPVYSAWNTQTSAGASTGEEPYLEQILDANGYATTLTLTTPPSGGQVFVQLGTAVFVGMTTGIPTAATVYPADTYRFQWQGKGSIKFSGDVTTLANASAGCSIVGTTVTSTNAWGTTNSVTLKGSGAGGIVTPSAGIRITIPSGGITDSLNYPKAMTCVQSTYTSLFDGGQVFHPNFLAAMQLVPWKALRFMDTLEINNLVSQSRFVGHMFSSAPTAATPLPALSAAWPGQSGQRRVTLSTGEELQVTFSTGSTAVTSTTNPTITAQTSTIPPGEVTTNFFWFAYDSWAARPQVGDLTYASLKGVPYEICIALCNLLNCDAWLNIPAAFQSADWTSFATLVTSNLKAGLKCFVEWGNEVWNSGSFTMPHWSLCKSQLAYGANDGASYTGQITSQMGQQIATTAGNPGFDNTFIMLMPGQAANPSGTLARSLTAPSWTSIPWQLTSASGQKLIKGVCVAPYFGNGPIWAADFTLMQAQPDGGYTDFLQQLTQNPVVSGNSYHDNTGATLPSGGWFQLAETTVTNTISAIAAMGALPVYCYEGSWQFDDSNNTHGQDAFLATAARDSRMNGIQQLYFRGIAAAGALPCQYKACSPYVQDEWGLFESSMQTFSPLTSAPARLQGAVAYVENG